MSRSRNTNRQPATTEQERLQEQQRLEQQRLAEQQQSELRSQLSLLPSNIAQSTHRQIQLNLETSQNLSKLGSSIESAPIQQELMHIAKTAEASLSAMKLVKARKERFFIKLLQDTTIDPPISVDDCYAALNSHNIQALNDHLDDLVKNKILRADQAKALKLSPDHATFAGHLRSINATNVLTPQQSAHIANLGPRLPNDPAMRAQRRAFRAQLSAARRAEFDQILDEESSRNAELLNKQTDFDNLVSEVVRKIEAESNAVELRERQQAVKKAWENQLGIILTPGQRLIKRSGGRTTVTEIQAVTFSPMMMDPTSGNWRLDTSEMNNQGDIEPFSAPHLLTRTYRQDSTGSIIPNSVSTEYLHVGKVAERVLEGDLSPEIIGLANLSTYLALPRNLQVGDNYTVTYDPPTPPQNVQITAIDEPNGEISFAQPVLIDQANSARGLDQDRRRNTLTFGDFSKLYLRDNLLPVMGNLQDLNTQLSQLHREQTRQDPNHTHPAINIEPNTPAAIMLTRTDGDPELIKVISADDQGVNVEGKGVQSFPHFLRDLKKHNARPATPEEIAANTPPPVEGAPPTTPPEGTSEEGGEDKPDKPKIPRKPGNIFSRAFDQVYGGITGFASNIIGNTSVYSLMDIYVVFKKIGGKIGEKYGSFAKDRQRNLNGQLSGIYGGVPFCDDIGTDEYNAYSKEMVKNYTEDLEKKNPSGGDILKVIYAPENVFQLKAYLEKAASKGILRFSDDPKLIASLEKHLKPRTYKKDLREVTNENRPVIIGEVVTEGGAHKNVSVIEQMRLRFDADTDFGKGFFDSKLLDASNSSYRNGINRGKELKSRYEFDQGGLEKNIRGMLQEHINGKINFSPAEFEGLLTDAIENNDLNPEQSLLYFVMAFGAKDKNGKTLLEISRFKDIINSIRSKNVIFEYFNGNEFPQFDRNGEPVMITNPDPALPLNQANGRFSGRDFEQLWEAFRGHLTQLDSKDGTGLGARSGDTYFRDWIYDNISHKKVAPKIIENYQSHDKGQYKYFAPHAQSNSDIMRLLNVDYGGKSRVEAIINSYAGYNDQMKYRLTGLKGLTSVSADNQSQLKDCKIYGQMISNFLFFDGNLSSRIIFPQNSRDLYRLSPEDYQKKSGTKIVRELRNETNAFIYDLLDRVVASPAYQADNSISNVTEGKVQLTANEIQILRNPAQSLQSDVIDRIQKGINTLFSDPVLFNTYVLPVLKSNSPPLPTLGGA